jgi:hypothetical protein
MALSICLSVCLSTLYNFFRHVVSQALPLLPTLFSSETEVLQVHVIAVSTVHD